MHSLYLFHHPAVEQEFDLFTSESAPDDFRAIGHLRLLQRNHFMVQALIGILEAYVGPSIGFPLLLHCCAQFYHT